MSGTSKTDSLAGQAAMAAPSVAAVLTTLDAITLQDWLSISGMVFIGLQALYLVWRWRRDLRREAERIADRDSRQPAEDKDEDA